MAKQKLTSLDAAAFKSWWDKKGKKLKGGEPKSGLMLVFGKKTEVPAIIYSKSFDSKRHTKAKNATAFAKEARKQGYVLSSDGKWVVLRTKGFWTDFTGKKAPGVSAKSSTRIGLRKKLLAQAKKKGVRASHKREGERIIKTIPQLRAAIRRKKPGKKVKKKKVKKKKGKKGKKGKKAKKGALKRMAKLEGGEE